MIRRLGLLRLTSRGHLCWLSYIGVSHWKCSVHGMQQIVNVHLGHFLLKFFCQICTQGSLRRILGPFSHFWNMSLFRWFKFTLSAWQITIGHLGHFLLDFLAQIWTQGTFRHILGPILVIFEICQFLTIPGPFEYFSEFKQNWIISIRSRVIVILQIWVSLALGGGTGGWGCLGWLAIVYMSSGMFRGKESSNRIELSRLVQELLKFGVLGSLWLWGGGRWVGGVLGHGGVPTCMHTCIEIANGR